MAGLQHISLALAALVVAGCPRDVVVEPPQRSVVRVRNFSDAAAVRAIAVAPPYVFVAHEAGLDRWDLSTGTNLRLNAEHGLAGDRVFGLDYDASRSWLWIATDGGLQRYDVAASNFTALPAPADVLGAGSLEQARIEAAGDGGVWLGLPTGLFYASEAEGWTNTGVAEAVRAVFRDRAGTLWIGTERGVLVTGADRVARRLGPEDGCKISRVDHIIAAPGGDRVLIVGVEAEQMRAALATAEGCSTYRAAPGDRWDAVASSDGGVIVLAGRALYRLDGARRQGPRRLERDGLRLVPLPGASLAAAKSLDLSRLDVTVPSGTEVVAAAGADLFLGTRTVGTARLTTSGQEHWLRRRELAAGAVHLTVACASKSDCLIATGTRHLWHFDGAGFRDVGDGDGAALAALRGPRGGLQILRGTPGEPILRLAARGDDGFVDVEGVEIETPGVEASISFARYAPGGALWLGLRYRDDAGEVHDHGVALVDVGRGEVVYHHAGGEADKGVLPVPISVVDAAFLGDEAWLATRKGAARVKGDEVELYSEARGLRSEILRGIACSAGGIVYVASGAGVGESDGEGWDHVRALGQPVEDLAIGADGQLWVATERGLGAYDGDRVRRLDARRGLLEDHIRELEVDEYGRIWLLGNEGISLVAP